MAIRALGLAPQVALIEKWRYRLAKNPRIGFEPIPNLNSEDVDVQYYSYRGKSNNLGFRDDNHEIEKPKDVLRIMILGDSVALGLWINDDAQIFSSIIQEQLNLKGSNVEVLNFAVAGYNTLQEIETLKEKGLAYSPDIVVLAYCQNDRERDDGGIYQILLAEERTGSRINSNRFTPYFTHSALYRFLAFKVFNPKLRINFDKLQMREWEAVQSESVESSLAELATLSKQHNFRTLIAVFPKFKADGRSIEYTTEAETLNKIAIQSDFDFIDLTNFFELCSQQHPAILAYDAFHLTTEGHRCAGDALTRYLQSRL